MKVNVGICKAGSGLLGVSCAVTDNFYPAKLGMEDQIKAGVQYNFVHNWSKAGARIRHKRYSQRRRTLTRKFCVDPKTKLLMQPAPSVKEHLLAAA